MGNKKKISLETANTYVEPADNTNVYRKDTTSIEYPNLIYSSTNPLYGLFGSGIGYNMHGQLIDYSNGGIPVTEEQAKKLTKAHYISPEDRRYGRIVSTLYDMRLDKYRINKKY